MKGGKKMKELKSILYPIKRKLFLESFLRRLLYQSIIALCILFFVLLLSKVKYIYHVNLLYAFILVFSICSCVLLSIFLDRPTDEQAAHAGDKLGYEQRLVTALELLKQDDQSIMSKLVIEDALQKTRGNNLGKQYRFKLPIKLFKINGILLVGIFVTAFVSAPQKEPIGQLIQPEIAQIQQIKKEVNKQNEMKKEQLKQFNQQINALTKGIKKSVTKSEAVKAIQNTQQELKKLEKKNDSNDLKKIGESLSQNEQTKELSQALQNGNSEKIAEALANLQKQMQQKDKTELSALSDFLKEAANGLTDKQLSQAINEFAQQMKNGTVQMGNLSEQLLQLAQQSEALENAVALENQVLAQASQSLQQNQTNQNNEAQANNNNGQNGDNQRNGNGEGQGNGNGNGQGQGQGQNEGTGTDGIGRGKGHTEPEDVYTRQAQDKAGYDTQIKGTKNEGGQTMQSQQKIFGSAGESIPYETVYQQYKDEALKNIENENIPYGMKQLVAEYFSTLEK